MPDSKPAKLIIAARKELAVREGHGKIRVLAVGVSDYPKKSGFKSLKQCTNDALQVFTAFREVQQLNGHDAHAVLMTSETKERLPSRGSVMDQIHELASEAQSDDRLLFYFSGHGHRIDGVDDHFLVPQDAYSESQPDAHLSMKKILEVLSTSQAKQKIIVLDACLSGPTLWLGRKLVAASYSEKFFAKYLAATKGIAVLSSSAADESSYTQSENPKLSLFTFYFVKALRGEPDALDEQVLTLPRLFDYVSSNVQRKCRDYRIQQTPSLETTVNGTLVLADFRRPLVVPSSVDLTAHPLNALLFRETRGEQTKCILTEWSNRSKTKEQLQWAANTTDAMAAYLKEDFGKWRPLLRKRFGFSPTDIETDGGTMGFPGGSLSHRYEAESKDSGSIHRELILDVDWFGDGARLASLLALFDFDPDTFELQLSMRLKPMTQIAGLEANGWDIRQESDEEVVAVKDGITMTVTTDTLAFDGFDIEQLLAGGANLTDDQKFLAETMTVVAPPKRVTASGNN
jgi:hypothetical protein